MIRWSRGLLPWTQLLALSDEEC